MISIGQKYCSEITNLEKPVVSYIKKTYKEKTSQAIEYALEKHKARLDLVNDLKSIYKMKPESLEEVIRKAEEYYSYLKSLQSRFRISTTKRSWGSSLNPFASQIIHFSFSWSDAFVPSVRFVSHNVEHEKATILFVLASLHSVVACGVDRKEENGIKRALHEFQCAAGILEELEITKIGKISTIRSSDLNPKLVAMLKELMLAQAQECVFEACLNKKVKATLLSEIAMGVAEKFEKALEYANMHFPSQWLIKASSTYPWTLHLRHQTLCWKACSVYHQSRDFLDKSEWGSELAALGKAEHLLKTAKSLEKDLKSRGPFAARHKHPAIDSILRASEFLESKISKRRAKAIKENEAIYHERVVPLDKLPTVEAKMIAKCGAFVETPIDAKSPYAVLVPAKIQEEAERFKHEVKEKIKSKKEECDKQDDAIREKLQALHLPGALEARETDSGIPDSLWDRIHKIQAKGGVQHIDGMLKQVLSSQDKAWEIYNATKAALDEEIKKDEELRGRFKGRWTRAPSKELTVEFNSQLSTCEGYLKKAAGADEKLSRKRKQEATNMSAILGSRETLESKVPKVAVGSTKQKSTPQEDALKADLDKLTKIIEARPKILELAAKKAEELDPETAILKDSQDKVDIKETKVKLMSAFDPYFSKLTKVEDLQNELLNFAYLYVYVDIHRSAYFNTLNGGVTAHETLTSNLMQGIKFYSDVMSTYLNPLYSQVKDFVVARDHEKKMYMDEITRALATGNSTPKIVPATSGVYAGVVHASASAPPPGDMVLQGEIIMDSSAVQPVNKDTGVAPMEVVAVSAQPTQPQGKPGEWACKMCTYLNQKNDLTCSMCGTKR
ncbi:hypothetical protein AAMO2058_001449000 [Amorphochlora amoebiformis]